MIRSRLRLKALSLCAVVLGLMAFSVSSAQAEPGANWMVNGNNVTSTLLPNLQIGELENKTVVLLTEIAGAKTWFLCTSAKLIGAKLETEGKITSGGKVLFHGCVTILNEKLSEVCVPKTAGQPAGLIESVASKGLLVLSGGQGVTLIAPQTGETFATLRFNVEGGCSLPETVPVKGELIVKDCKNEVKTELVSHLIEADATSHLYVISDTKEHAAILDGSATAILEGTDVGLKWSGLPA